MRISSWAKLTCGTLFLYTMTMKSAESFHFQTGETQTALLELYTSEGCSSCPPAETWLSRLKESPKLWNGFVPVTFHVEYWDYLGWKDPFAAKAYTERQHDYADHWRSRSVYTPGFVLDGKEWRGWSGHDELTRASSKTVGMLTALSEDGRQWTFRFQPSSGNVSSSYQFHAALLGFDLTSDVKAGENRGRKLQHDFVALTMGDGKATKSGDFFQGTVSLNNPTNSRATRLGFAAWVTLSASLQPLQAVGGWLTPTNAVLSTRPAAGQK